MVQEVVRHDEFGARDASTAPGTADPRRADSGESPSRRHRRRRSGAALPSHLEPVEIPDDSPGRVEYISVEMPEVVAAAATPTAPDDAAWAMTLPVAASPAAVSAWVAVVALGALLVAIFVAGMALTR